MGCHSKPSRIRLPHGASAAAAPTLASVVAAFFLSQQMPVTPAAAETVPSHSANLDAVYQTGASSAPEASSRPATLSSPQLMAATREVLLSNMQAAWHAAWQEKPSTSLPAWYKVQPGDSLSAIAERFYNNPAAWPVLYWRNHGQIRWADDITAGQVLRIPAEPARIPSPPAQLEAAPPPMVRTVADYTPRHASSAPVQAQSAPALLRLRPRPRQPPAVPWASSRAARSASAWSSASPAETPRS